MSRHPLHRTLWTLAFVGACSGAGAVGFGAATTSALIGSPLDFSVSLQLAPGERITPDCLAADVAMGATLLPPSAVSVGVQAASGQVRVRVLSRDPVTEPIVGVVVAVGCPVRIARRFTVLADPPAEAAMTQPMPPAVAAASGASPLPPLRQPAPVQAGPRLRVEAPTVQAGSSIVPAPESAAEHATSRPQPGLAAADAARAAEAAEAAASAARGRVLALENSLLALRMESRQQREALARLEADLARAREQALMGWAVGGLALLLGLAAAALGWRRRREPRPAAARRRWSFAARGGAESEPDWGAGEPVTPVVPQGATRGPDGVAPAGTAAAATGSASLALAPMADVPGAPAEWAVRDDGGLVENEAERTRLMAPAELAASEPLPTVSAEESLELEQQVDFLTVLGREEAAVGLLTEHLRKTGGTFPMPFLKLMDIHRRCGDRAAYESVRARFNQRFNAVAAAFGAAPVPARGLEEHPGLIQRIEQAWADPVESMTLLENLIFRSDDAQLLDLPALEEVVFLHAVARDVRQHSGERITEVDVLLSLEEHGSDIPVAVPEALPPVGRGAPKPDALAAQARSSAPADAWPSIDESRFDVGGLRLEPEPVRGRAGTSPGG